MGALSQFEEYAGSLLWGHLSAGKGVGGIGFLKTVKHADYFLHKSILLWVVRLLEGLSSCERRSAEETTGGLTY